MKAIRVHQYGLPHQLVYEDAPDPLPGPGEVLVEVAAAGVNPADYKFRNGSLAEAAPLAMPFVPGMDIVGTIVATGDGVARWQVGDRVLAMLYLMGNGGYAERVCVPAEWCAHLPSGLDDRLAATLPTPATTSVEWIEDDLKVKSGDRVLITGATGAVGRIACYVAKSHGAHVTAAVRAARVVDVRHADATLVLDGPASPIGPFDFIADTVGGSLAESLLRLLKPGGTLSTIGTDPVGNPQAHDVHIRRFACFCDAERLERITRAAARGELELQVPQLMPLSQAARSHELLERGGAGKMVLVPDAKWSAAS